MSRVINLDSYQQFAAINVNSDPGYIPGPKIIPNAAMVRLNWTLTDGKVAHNVLYATYTGTPALGTSIADNVFVTMKQGAPWVALAAFLAPTLTFTGVTVLDVRSNTGVEYSSTIASAPGTSTGAALPDEVAVVVTIRTNQRGPSGRGRFFIPGWAANALAAGNVVAPAAITALTNWANASYAGIASALGAPVLGLPARAGYTSPITGRVFPARIAVAVPTTSFVVKNNTWDSQRRRGLR